jgi:hypothetical protein
LSIKKKFFNAQLYTIWSDVATTLRTCLVTDLGLASSVTSSSNIVVTSSGLEVEISMDGLGNYTIGITEGVNTATWTLGSSSGTGYLRSVITTSNGLIMDFASYGTPTYYSSIIFAKTNANKLCVICNTPSYNVVDNGSEYYTLSTFEAANDDDYIPTTAVQTRVTLTSAQKAAMTQTSLVPFIFWPSDGDTSYAPSAMYSIRPIDIGDGYSNRIMGSYHYTSNGLIWLKDDPV